ncbi:MAG TPA: zf-HC2 domain-containing protein [Thermoanaerobaculia bacterium]|nr:zf-HC2 domain-containing protein [Thermoanaerobaculia bacterium]
MTPEQDPGEPHDLNQLAAFVEGRLAPEERRSVERHLTGCESCRAALAAWSRGAPESSFARSRTALPIWLGAAAAVALAAWIANRVASVRPGSIPPGPEPTTATATGAPAMAPAPPAAPSSTDQSEAPAAKEPEPLGVKRGGERRIAGKSFRLVSGVWIDEAYDATSLMPVTDVADPAVRDKVLSEEPRLRPFQKLGQRFVVVLGGRVYRFTLSEGSP